jgi:hypothetical protein
MMPLDYACVTMSLRDPRNIDWIAGLENVSRRDHLAELELTFAALAEFASSNARGYLGLGEVTSLGCSHPRQPAFAVSDLDSFVTVRRLGSDLRHCTGPKLDHGHRLDTSGGVTYLGHPQLFTNQSAKHRPTRA